MYIWPCAIYAVLRKMNRGERVLQRLCIYIYSTRSTRVQGGPQGPGPQGTRGAHKGPAHEGPGARKGPAHKRPGGPMHAVVLALHGIPAQGCVPPGHSVNGTWQEGNSVNIPCPCQKRKRVSKRRV